MAKRSAPGTGLPDYGGTHAGGINRSQLPAPPPAPAPIGTAPPAAGGATAGEDRGPRDYSNKPTHTYRFALDATFTRNKVELDATGYWVTGFDAATGNLDANAFVRFQEDERTQGSDPGAFGHRVGNGFSISGQVLRTVYVTNPMAQAGKIIEITFWRDHPDDRVDVAQ